MASLVPDDDAAGLAKALGQVSEEVAVNGRSVTVAPFRLRQLSNVLKCVQRLRDAGVIEDKTLKEAARAEGTDEAVKRLDVLKMFLNGGDEIINILRIATDLQAHVIDNLDIPTGVRLIAATFKVNLDFFYRNREEILGALMPAIEAVENIKADGVGALAQPPTSPDGPQQSTDSSPPGTATT